MMDPVETSSPYRYVVTFTYGTALRVDQEKAVSNLRKRGVSFETALRAFAHPLARSVQDRIEEGEERWQTLGMMEGHLLLLVAHTVQDEDERSLQVEVILIISARVADRKERRRYEQESLLLWLM